MCVSMYPARLTGTVLYFGDAIHPKHGYVHVLGYQNQVQNQFSGPNAMILHFPTSRPMTPENVVDTEPFSKFMDDMVSALRPPVPRGGLLAKSATRGADTMVHSFEHGIYHIVMSADASQIPKALQTVPEEKRPRVNQKLFDWYAREFPQRTLALCCFNNTEARKATPMLWYYSPIDNSTFFAPAVDSHTGDVPDFNEMVYVDHWCIVGSPNLTTQSRHVAPVNYQQRLSEEAAALLPRFVMGRQFSGQMPNSDFLLPNASKALLAGDLSALGRDTQRVF